MERKLPLPTIAEIAQALAPFGPGLSPDLSGDQLSAIQRYIDILLLWNEKVSLTAVHDPLEIAARHFGESIFAGSFVSFAGGRLADAGAGAGFPGLALKIAFPQLEIALIEPNAKKCAFLREIVDRLALRNVEVLRCQYAEVMTAGRQFDYLCSRALGHYKDLLNWARSSIAPGGRILLWLGYEDSVRVERIQGWQWQVPEIIPESNKRLLLIGRKDEK